MGKSVFGTAVEPVTVLADYRVMFYRLTSRVVEIAGRPGFYELLMPTERFVVAPAGTPTIRGLYPSIEEMVE